MDTQKFQKNTFDAESLEQVRNISEQLYESEAGLSDISQCISFVRVSLEKILLESGKMQIEDEEILKLQNIILEDIAIQEYISEKMGRLFPISLIEKLRFGKSLQEISQYFLNNLKLAKIISRADERALYNALFIAKNIEEFKKVLSTLGIHRFLVGVEKEKIGLIQEVFQLENIKSFKKFLENGLPRNFFTHISYTTLQRLGELGLKQEHLEEIFQDDDFEKFLLSPHRENIRRYLFSLCHSMEDVLEIGKFQYKNNLETLQKDGYLEKVFEILSITDIQSLIEIEKKFIFFILARIPKEKLSWFFRVFEPQNKEELFLYFEYDTLNDFLEIDQETLDFLYSFYEKDIKHKLDYFSQSHIGYFLKNIDIDFFTDILQRFDMFSQKGFEIFLADEKLVRFSVSTSRVLFEKVLNMFNIQNYGDLQNIFLEYPDLESLLISGRHELENLNLLISIFNTEKKEDVIQISTSERTCLFLGIHVHQFRFLMAHYKFVDLNDFITFCESIESRMTLVQMEDRLLKSIVETYKKEDFGKVLQSRYLQKNTTVIERPPSHILFECFDTEIQGKDALKLMGRKAKKILAQKEKQEQISEDERLDLSIYVRFGSQVDYPEIADALIIFAQHYIGMGYSQIFKNIRIIPRYLNEKRRPSKELFKKQEGFPETQYFNVASEKFKDALHERSLAIFLSHSSISRGSQGFPNLISQGMGGESGYSDISSEIELEAKYTQSDFTRTSDFEELFEEFFRNLRALEKAYIAHIKK